MNSIGTAIRCDARCLCRYMNDGSFVLSKEVLNPNSTGGDGNIYATGYSSIYGTSSLQVVIETTRNYDIFCTGSYSCYYQFLKNGNNLYCTAAYACQYSPLISDFVNVFGYGQYSLRYGSIEFIDHLYCGGYESCYDTVIDNVFDSVYGNNYRVLSNSQISNIVNNVIGMGYQSLYQSIIYNVSNVYCISTQSCQNANIRAVHNKIEANGNNALSGSVIISESKLEMNGSLIIYINGTNDANTFDIFCNDTDICEIYCQSTYACSSLVLHCSMYNNTAGYRHHNESQCFVWCDETANIYCPINGTYTQMTATATTTTLTTTSIPLPNTSVTVNTAIATTTAVTTSIANVTSKPATTAGTTATTVIISNTQNSIENSRRTTVFLQESNNSGIKVDENALIVVLVLASLIFVSIILLFVYCHRKQAQVRKELALKEIELRQQMKSQNLKLSLQNDKGSNKFSVARQVTTSGHQSDIDLQNTSSIHNINQFNSENHNRDQLSQSLENLFKDLKIQDDMHAGGDELFLEGRSQDPPTDDEGFTLQLENVNDTAIGNTSVKSTDAVHINGDEDDYRQWTRKQVILWLKLIVLEAKVGNEAIVCFLREIYKKNVTGIMLNQFKNDEQFMYQFVASMSLKNQTFVIWMPIKVAIDKLESDHQQ